MFWGHNIRFCLVRGLTLIYYNIERMTWPWTKCWFFCCFMQQIHVCCWQYCCFKHDRSTGNARLCDLFLQDYYNYKQLHHGIPRACCAYTVV